MNLQDAADRLGVHYQTAYRWVRDGSLAATKAKGNSYEVSEQEVARFLARRLVPIAPPDRIHVRDWEHHVERLLQALVIGDELVARLIVDRLADGSVSVLEVCENLISPALAEIGERWHHGTLSIAEEHRATAICERALARISTHPRGRPRGCVVVTTPPGDFHSMPSAMAALALREDRWKVHHLGANVPIEDIVKLVDDVDADLVVITVTNADVAPAATALEEALAARGRVSLTGKPGMSLRMLLEQARGALDENGVTSNEDIDV
jgi:MerR family transcriptional regulator, light-induced transcriptional regulator